MSVAVYGACLNVVAQMAGYDLSTLTIINAAGWNLLHVAVKGFIAQGTDTTDVVRHLLTHGVDALAHDNTGRTPLACLDLHPQKADIVYVEIHTLLSQAELGALSSHLAKNPMGRARTCQNLGQQVYATPQLGQVLGQRDTMSSTLDRAETR